MERDTIEQRYLELLAQGVDPFSDSDIKRAVDADESLRDELLGMGEMLGIPQSTAPPRLDLSQNIDHIIDAFKEGLEQSPEATAETTPHAAPPADIVGGGSTEAVLERESTRRWFQHPAWRFAPALVAALFVIVVATPLRQVVTFDAAPDPMAEFDASIPVQRSNQLTAPSSKETGTQTLGLTAASARLVDVSLPNGRIHVRGADVASVQVSLAGKQRSPGVASGALEDVVDSAAGTALESAFAVDVLGDVTVVRAEDASFDGDVVIDVPRGANVNVTSPSAASINVTGVAGNVSIDGADAVHVAECLGDIAVANTISTIRIEDIVGGVTASSEEGSISASFERLDADQSVSLNAGGPVELSLPPDADGSFSFESESGDVFADFFADAKEEVPAADGQPYPDQELIESMVRQQAKRVSETDSPAGGIEELDRGLIPPTAVSDEKPVHTRGGRRDEVALEVELSEGKTKAEQRSSQVDSVSGADARDANERARKLATTESRDDEAVGDKNGERTKAHALKKAGSDALMSDAATIEDKRDDEASPKQPASAPSDDADAKADDAKAPARDADLAQEKNPGAEEEIPAAPTARDNLPAPAASPPAEITLEGNYINLSTLRRLANRKADEPLRWRLGNGRAQITVKSSKGDIFVRRR